MIEAKPLPIPGIDIVPQLQNRIPFENVYTGPKKQRVTVNTPQGDKVRVQDLNTKEFLNWEDINGEPIEFGYDVSGVPSQDFPGMRVVKTPAFATGGSKTDPPSWIGPGALNNPYILPPLEVRANPNRPPYNYVSPYSNPKPTWGEDYPDPGFMPSFLRPGPTIENSKKDYLDKGLQSNGKPWGRPTFVEVEPGNLSQDAQPDGPVMEVLKFLDPTGLLSWGDARKAYDQWQQSKRPAPTLSENLDMFSAVPALGKYGKLAYLSKGIKPVTKFFDWQRALNAADLVDDVTGAFSEQENSKDPNFIQRAWSNITEHKGPHVIKTPAFKTGGVKEKKCYTCVGRKRRV
jgi:hypothetical protein